MPRVSAAARPAIGTMSIGPKRDLRGARRTSKKTAASTAAAMAKPSNWKYCTRPSSVLAGPDVSQPVTMIQPIMSRAAAMPIRATRPAARVMRELPSGAERWRGRVAARRVDGLVFSADGSLLASTAQEGRTVELWQVLAGRQAAVLEIRDSRTAAFHPTEPTLVVGGLGMLYVVDAQRGEIARTLPNVHGGENVYAAAFSSDGQVLATASDQGSIKVWTWPALTLRTSVSMSKSLEQMAPVPLVLGRQGTGGVANGPLGRVHR